MDKPRFIKWADVLSYDAPFNLIIAKRELGKTFGLREQMLRDWFANGESHIAIVRYKDDINVVANDYFGQIVAETNDQNLKAKLEGYEFQTCGNLIKIRKKSDGKKKNKWVDIVRIIPLSKATRYKQASMHKLRRVVFDEALIDKSIDTYTRYLPNEYALFQNLIGTLQRYSEKDGAGRPRLRVYLMGNAVDLINPYFAKLGITEPPEFGGRWFAGKSWYFYYPDPRDFAVKADSAQMAERLGARAGDYGNEFESDAGKFIAKKPSSARFSFGVVYRGERFGVWGDLREGLYYINTKIPNDPNAVVYALSTSDSKPNYIVAKRANKTLQNLADLYCYGILRYDTPATREHFNDVLALFGVH